MSDRPTPETDAAQHEGLLRGHPTPTLVVRASFARRLERQRDEARDLARELAGRIEQILLCKSGPHEWVVGNLRLAAKQAEWSMIKAKEVLP